MQIWPFLEDFFGLNKWFPTLTTCVPVEGISAKPGCVHYYSGFKKLKLLCIDPKAMGFSYSIVDGNIGFNEYVSTVKVFLKEHGCKIEWKYEVKPAEGWRFEDLSET
ncbi:lachrymatory-factor synthase-like [Jatropha curcas]|uniref:lachrymatory-factor synthase-like n=1 Tax=Jatropha curcas TaxID=180498 RepID=UPI0018941935|nr:lachrymatory-factor synthase-like [Jatropha curcas]